MLSDAVAICEIITDRLVVLTSLLGVARYRRALWGILFTGRSRQYRYFASHFTASTSGLWAVYLFGLCADEWTAACSGAGYRSGAGLQLTFCRNRRQHFADRDLAGALYCHLSAPSGFLFTGLVSTAGLFSLKWRLTAVFSTENDPYYRSDPWGKKRLRETIKRWWSDFRGLSGFFRKKSVIGLAIH